MIYGIGNDITEIARVKKAIENPRFLEICFSAEEIELMRSHGARAHEIAAGNFSVKESVAKALGTGVRGFSLPEIAVLRDGAGKPVVHASGRFAALLAEHGVGRILVSISHTAALVSTCAVLECADERSE